MTRRADQRGQTSVLIIGFAVIVAMLLAVVVDASAAYLQRQRLNALADGAALAAADGVQGERVYTDGLDDRAAIDPVAAREYVDLYLARLDAHARRPGLTYSVRVSGDAVVVEVQAPLDLPLTLPGVGDSVTVSGTASAVVAVTP